MSATETKKPIGFDMELTEEQLKAVAGGDITSHNVIATYECSNPNCQRITNKISNRLAPPKTIACPDCAVAAQLIKTERA